MFGIDTVFMKIRSALRGLLLLPVLLAPRWGLNPAHAGQTFSPPAGPESSLACRFGCPHFEGYVVVLRHAEAARRLPARPEAVLSANRLYLPSEDSQTP